MTLIINLSSVHTLHPITKSVAGFVSLCNKYSKTNDNFCPTLFNTWTNTAWVWYQFYKNEEQLIKPYKRGDINTEQFLKNLLNIFSFIQSVASKPEAFLQLNGGESYSEDFGLALLENAWNEIIDLDITTSLRFPKVHKQSESDLVYLISNTNELNVRKILRLLKKQNPEINFVSDLDLSVQHNKEPIKIAPNIFLCLSYRYQLFKTANDSQSAKLPTTMSLLNQLIKHQLSAEDVSNIRVVSQYQGDLTEAENLGVLSHNAINAKDFFNESSLEFKKFK